MINIVKSRNFLSVNSPNKVVNNIQYFGEDAINIDIDNRFNELIRSSMYKECTTYNGDKGIIIGFEDNQSLIDYYFIVYCPESESVVYELLNDNDFIESIEK